MSLLTLFLSLALSKPSIENQLTLVIIFSALLLIVFLIIVYKLFKRLSKGTAKDYEEDSKLLKEHGYDDARIDTESFCHTTQLCHELELNLKEIEDSHSLDRESIIEFDSIFKTICKNSEKQNITVAESYRQLLILKFKLEEKVQPSNNLAMA